MAVVAPTTAPRSAESFWADADRHLVRYGGEFTREIIDSAATEDELALGLTILDQALTERGR